MYEPTIGLEIHTELKTKTKMFCECLNDPDEKHPNINVCPICLAHPGVLPVINKKAVEAVLKLGLALNSKIPETSKFDRKNYFYPDLPKGYQISQYDKPLVIGGELNGIRITRIHLEEDAGRLVHSLDGKSSLVDFNRAGLPLMELVTEPVIKSGKQAVDFAQELQLIMRYLGISDADMEKGQMRIEVNISLQDSRCKFVMGSGEGFFRSGTWICEGSVGEEIKMNARVEIKNLNSFRSVGEAIDYEIKRQTEVLEKSEAIKQETRGWDDVKKHTVSQRSKEEAHDYRYFPEPDLPPMDLTPPAGGFDLENLKIEIPELPEAKRKRFISEYNLTPQQVEILVSDRYLAAYFEEAVSELLTDLKDTYSNYNIKQGDQSVFFPGILLLYNLVVTNVTGTMTAQEIFSIKELKITPENLADLVVLIDQKEITHQMAKDIIKEMAMTGLDPRQIIEQKGLKQVSDEDSLKQIVEQIIKENPKAIEDYKKGKENALQFLIGQTMAKSKGRSNPESLKNIFKNLLS